MKPEEITKAAVIGAGLMGHGIAQMLASQGCAVALLDLSQSFLEKGFGKYRLQSQAYGRARAFSREGF